MGAISEQEQPAAEKDELSDHCCRFMCLVVFLSLVGLLVYFFIQVVILCLNMPDPPEYSMEIAAVSGLDPYTDLQGSGVLSPEFNVTVRIASRSRNEECLAPDMSVEVSYSYLKVPLAAGRMPAFCAKPWQLQEQAAVARGRSVVVPGFLLDSLAEDMRNGQAVFRVKLMTPHLDHWDKKLSCWGKVGAPCEDSASAALLMPQPADSGHVPRPAVGTM